MMITDHVADHPAATIRAYLACHSSDDLGRWPAEMHSELRRLFLHENPGGQLPDFQRWLKRNAADDNFRLRMRRKYQTRRQRRFI